MRVPYFNWPMVIMLALFAAFWVGLLYMFNTIDWHFLFAKLTNAL